MNPEDNLNEAPHQEQQQNQAPTPMQPPTPVSPTPTSVPQQPTVSQSPSVQTPATPPDGVTLPDNQISQVPTSQEQPQSSKPTVPAGPNFGATPQPNPDMLTSASQMQPKNRPPLFKRLLVVLLILIVILGVAIAAYVFVPKLRSSLATRSENSQLSSLEKSSSSITAAQLAKLNKTNLFYGVFKHAAQQQVVHTKTGLYFSDKAKDYRDIDSAYDTYMDYGTKKYSLDTDTYTATSGTQPDKNRCIGTQEYNLLRGFGLGWQKSDSSTRCTFESVGNYNANDGLNVGGLTSAQADTFVAAIRKRSGLLTVNSASLKQHNNKNYVMFDVTVTPIKLSDGLYWGLQNFMWSFKETGLDPAKQPYSYAGAGGDGLRIHYYVDPATQLPAYAQFDTTAVLDKNGKPTASTFDYRHVEYTFGGSVPTLSLTDSNAITFDWPTDKI